MSISEAQKRATAKYHKNNYDRIELKVKKGHKDKIENAANLKSETVSAYIKKAVSDRIKTETGTDIEL